VDALSERWELYEKPAHYRVDGEGGERLKAAGLPTLFSAVSIGISGGGPQVAIIPLDESSLETARHIVALHNETLGG
jgi:hypothetical protein